jgi:hypothetical protein
MQMLSGAVLILAATVVFTGAIIGAGFMSLTYRDTSSLTLLTTIGAIVAFVLGVMGLGAVVSGAKSVNR